MAPKAQQPEGVIEGLRSVYTDLAGLMLSPDATQHQQFLQQLMGGIQQYVTSRAMAATKTPMPGGQPPAGGAPGPGGPPGMGPAGPGGPGPAQGPPNRISGGATPNPLSMPNPDELRRVLAGA